MPQGLLAKACLRTMQHYAKVLTLDLKIPANLVLVPFFKKDLFEQLPIFGRQPSEDASDLRFSLAQ